MIDRTRFKLILRKHEQKIAVILGIGWTAVIIVLMAVTMLHFGWHLH